MCFSLQVKKKEKLSESIFLRLHVSETTSALKGNLIKFFTSSFSVLYQYQIIDFSETKYFKDLFLRIDNLFNFNGEQNREKKEEIVKENKEK